MFHRLGGPEALELCRDKRLVLVGDSLNRNMWESLACILYAAVPDRSRTRIVDDAGSEYRIFRAMVSDVCLHATTHAVCTHDDIVAGMWVRRLLLLSNLLFIKKYVAKYSDPPLTNTLN